MSDMFRRRRPTSSTIGAPDRPAPRRERKEDQSDIGRMIEDARPSGRMTELQPDSRRRHYADRWKALVRGTRAPEPKPRAPVFEPSRYENDDDRDDD